MALHKRLLDLCSGLGGASQAFKDDKNWQVLHVDKEKFPLNDITIDVKELANPTHPVAAAYKEKLYKFKPFLIWASPPCQEFSVANVNFRRKMREEGAQPNTEIVEACKKIIDDLKPQFWIIENVSGAVPYISAAIGQELRHRIGAWYFWGNFPLFGPQYEGTPNKNWKYTETLPHREQAAIRSKVPYMISAGLKEAIEKQSTLDNFIKGIDL